MNFLLSLFPRQQPKRTQIQDTSWVWAMVAELSGILQEYRLLSCRGTPASGKTTLAHLLCAFYERQNVPVVFFPSWVNKKLSLDPNHFATMIIEAARQKGHEFVTYSSLWWSDLVIIIDEAQMSYDDHGLWLGLIKSVGGMSSGTRIALFSSYGSPTGGPSSALPGSPNVIIGAFQRVSLTPSIMSFSPNIGLFYTRDEFDDIVFRSALKHEKKEISAADIRVEMDKPQSFFDYLNQFAIGRSFPSEGKMTPQSADILRKVLVEGSIERDNNEGIRQCYEQGWLHAELLQLDKEPTCIIPTKLHAKFIEYKFKDKHANFPDADFPTIHALTEAVLRQFSRRNLRSVKRFGIGAVNRPVEATYQDEFYR
ncbi:hypothetical protein N7495_006511 [Penicillium taxi]|uniref:uncharacterized protein n=1 Tax=Penicillium taxi TaxID=168475 RepID=UPI0025453599|nr:uncharacterized protein N7495_006511 [Penicillium taxi]KAJ5894820.1 hypothetical protein N7495_006511 [Penicillium taxi]